MRPELRNLLISVSKPYRLVGGEVGSCVKNWDAASVRVCLAFPDTYEMGMSHLGLAILYDILNGHDEFLAERVFAPWMDTEAELRAREMKLFSLETQHALDEFDVIGITLPYELTYTNILNILDLGGVKIRAADRGEADPLVIAGGPSAFNPEPVADFFDAIVLGDGEEAILEIANAVKKRKETGATREHLLSALSEIRGVYVPSLYRRCGAALAHERVHKATIADLNEASFPEQPIVAHAAVQDRAGIEIQRGCVRGCRFCQAGMVYRPMRQRAPGEVRRLALKQLSKGGHHELSLLSLSVGDYACLGYVLGSIGEAREDVRMALPSLRTESLTQEVLERLGHDRSGSFTLAPEAATERMRAFINKGNTDDDLYASVEKVFQNGWSKIKLYFMVGLPGETGEEIAAIERMANRCRDIGRRHHPRPTVTVSTSTFVPKPHTPLQWAGQIGADEALEIQRTLKRTLKLPGIYYRWHDAHMSMLEGVFSRGGRELAAAIEHAFAHGARFDGWDDAFDLARWQRAFDACGIDAPSYLAPRDRAAELPWDHLFADLKKDFLLRELDRAQRGEATPSCADGFCQACGVCDFETVKNRLYDACHSEGGTIEESLAVKMTKARDPSPSAQDDKHATKLRIRFSKLGRASYLGHLELMDALRRTLRRAEIPVGYSEGYHPRPKMSMGRALPVGTESVCEYLDVVLTRDENLATIIDRLNDAAPVGVHFSEVHAVEGTTSIEDAIAASQYEVQLPGDGDRLQAADNYRRQDSCEIDVVRKGKKRSVDLKGLITELAVADNSMVRLTVSHRGSSVKVGEALGAIFKLEERDVRELNIRKVAVEFKRDT